MSAPHAAARDAWLAKQGVDVLRIGASAVYRDPSGTADGIILRALERIAGD